VKKRSKKWVWVAAVATIVAITALALLFRERPPYAFLRDASYVRTRIGDYPVHGKSAFVYYEPKTSIGVAYQLAKEELVSKGWSEVGGELIAPSGSPSSIHFSMEIISSESAPKGERVPRETRDIVVIGRPATAMDRFRDWLDRVTKR
jgi:hypothetical protein